MKMQASVLFQDFSFEINEDTLDIMEGPVKLAIHRAIEEEDILPIEWLITELGWQFLNSSLK
jgi:hypothetical protein